MDTSAECDICTEKFTKRDRKPITCLFCNKISCVNCIKNNFLSNGYERHCLHCGEKWDDLFISENFTETFQKTIIKPCKEKIMLDEEIAKLPVTQDFARLAKHTEEMIHYRKSVLTERISETRQLLDELLVENKKIMREIVYNTSVLNGKENEAKVSYNFSHKCPENNCNGYLDKHFECGTCNVKICKHCFIKLEENHVCDENEVSSLKIIRKDSKPCPGCSQAISKIDGCDQMWCVICKITFSWNTGRICKGPIHNPEYFRWISEHGNQEPENNAMDIPERHNNCVFPNDRVFLNTILLKYPSTRLNPGNVYINHPIYIKLQNILSLGIYIDDMNGNSGILRTLEINYENEEIAKRILRINYLNNKIDKEKWKNSLFLLNKSTNKNRSLKDVFLLLKIVMLQELWKIFDTINQKNPDYKNIVENSINECNKVREYCNLSFIKIGKIYGSTVYNINENWKLNSPIYVKTAEYKFK